MPNRIIKESICTSETLASISPEAERLWWRLVVSADDYGRFYGEPKVVLGKALTTFIGQVTVEQVASWLQELERAGLIELYEADGRPFLQIVTWTRHQQVRAKTSKFPESTGIRVRLQVSASRCTQMPADVPVIENEYENEYENDTVVHDAEGVVDKDPGAGAPGGAASATDGEPSHDDAEGGNPSLLGDGVSERDGAPKRAKRQLPIEPKRVVEIWNEIAPPALPAAMKLSDGRRRKLVARITAEPGRDEAWWRAYFGRVRDSPFLCGENDSGWKADLDWVIASEDRVARILEGRYDRRTPPKPKRPKLPEW